MWTLEDFVVESNKIEGIINDRFSLVRDIKAHERFLALKKITVSDLENFVTVIQSGAILRRSVGQDVRVGNYIAPRGGPEIEKQLEELVSMWVSDSYNLHIKYELLHPFTDGNGRSGRVLWLWDIGGKAPLGFLHSFYYQTLEANQ